MTFTYKNKQYDLRLQARYLPKPFRTINTLDLAILLANRGVDNSYKLKILNEYATGVTL